MSKSPQRPAGIRWHSGNLLRPVSLGFDLWHFHSPGQTASPPAPVSVNQGDRCPTGLVGKGWRQTVQPRLNLAWLPAGHAYVRLLQVPRCDPDELVAMLELQLDKVSPLPPAQTVWTYELLPSAEDEPFLVAFLIAERTEVERYLGTLEQAGYLPDCLEVPLIHLVEPTPPGPDGVWIHTEEVGDQMACLSAWSSGGRYRLLNLHCVSSGEDGARELGLHLTRLAWAGQVEGWLGANPQWHLRCQPERAAAWGPVLREQFGASMRLEEGPSPQDSVRIAARRSFGLRSRAGLLPPEHASRYRQHFVDRLWMQGLAGAVALYLLAVAVYAILLRYEDYRYQGLRQEVASLAPAYTNALTLRERLRVFEEQAGLKYAALDCWRITSELLPENVTLQSLNFLGGDKLALSGTVVSIHEAEVTDFNANLRKARVGGDLLFDESGVDAPKFTRLSPDLYKWDFTAKLKVSWLE